MSDYDQSSAAMSALAEAWTALQNLTWLRPIRSLADFERVHALTDALSDEVGDLSLIHI